MPIAIVVTAVTVGRRPLAGAIVDASVAVKWVMAEAHAEAALRLLESGIGLTAPAHWLGEAVNAIWAACRRGDLVEQEAHERAATLAEAPIAVVPLDRLVSAAMTLALRLGITVYDALYLALAEQQGALLVTDDRRLLTAAHHDRQLRDRVIWIGDDTAMNLGRGSR
ncbi:MAG TPA: type II toxin-antitoxin system VapC family toxin [Acetobacteraceae bacterium]|nr:type II toxin-antitoxin system VapC family toxin [Acetobacteraceae bacterium]